jgi:integrase/recombinase XerD
MRVSSRAPDDEFFPDTPQSNRETRLLTSAEFQRLGRSSARGRVVQEHPQRQHQAAYQNAIKDFMLFAAIKFPEEFRLIKPADVIAWSDGLQERILNGTTIRHRLAALSALAAYLRPEQIHCQESCTM